ncbi:hypothetical protein [Hyphomonas sp.]|uniref:hypothetical protein n=1 Tax=Hyphomonas sp. TaxID=87 RepID=UPI00391A87C0
MRTFLAIAAMAAGMAAPAHAQATEGWSGQVTPYIWGAGFSGEVRPVAGGPVFEVKESVFEVLDDLEGAFFLTGLARRGDLVIVGDISWSSSSRTESPGQGLPPVKGSVDSLFATVVAGRRIQAQSDQTIDFLAGVRVWDIDATADVQGLPLSASRSVSLIDPVIAVRFNRQHTNGFSTIAYGDIGGFGVGADFSAQAAVTVNYAINEQAYVSGGYRYVHLDYEKRGARIDIRFSGPLLGFTWRFD